MQWKVAGLPVFLCYEFLSYKYFVRKLRKKFSKIDRQLLTQMENRTIIQVKMKKNTKNLKEDEWGSEKKIRNV